MEERWGFGIVGAAIAFFGAIAVGTAIAQAGSEKKKSQTAGTAGRQAEPEHESEPILEASVKTGEPQTCYRLMGSFACYESMEEAAKSFNDVYGGRRVFY